MTLYRVFYSEIVEYEDYLEAKTEAEAEVVFKEKLEKEILEPIDVTIEEFEIEETMSHVPQ